ncbi:hypothetical protein BN2475_310068 [Paraburkholderia ribeironis]|uniref:Uncharacterized protein n=1 Tax=Paraburkholderia ribeironis TaxID=1247936 RepID=A0A1N7S2C8_9BURK|nr:hypothetical protein BN2475_310068 [Paraburkholderia ribeironis]
MKICSPILTALPKSSIGMDASFGGEKAFKASGVTSLFATGSAAQARHITNAPTMPDASKLTSLSRCVYSRTLIVWSP